MPQGMGTSYTPPDHRSWESRGDLRRTAVAGFFDISEKGSPIAPLVQHEHPRRQKVAAYWRRKQELSGRRPAKQS
jgi:hypothetical protein